MNKAEKALLLKRVGANIRKLRIAKKIEVKELAARLGISPQALGNIEKGKVDLNISRIIEIAKVLQVGFLSIFNTVDSGASNLEKKAAAINFEKSNTIEQDADVAKINFIAEFERLANNLVANMK